MRKFTLVFYNLNGSDLEVRMRDFESRQEAVHWAEHQVADGCPTTRRRRLWVTGTGDFVWEGGDFSA